MLLKKIWQTNKFVIISFSLYILITFPAMMSHIPWYDEAHAYLQAYFMNWGNWIDVLKAEGHPLLWFLILMPFAKAEWSYPYPMLIINYIFCLCAVLTVLLKAPFSKWIKLATVFSSMFLIYFPIVARGYSTGILFLFLLAVYYKDKLKHPLLYPTLIALTLNTNIICGIAASWFGLIFFIELLKSNINVKTKAISISILVLSTFLLIYPFVGGFGSEASKEDSYIGLKYLYVFFAFPFFIQGIVYIATLITTLIKTRFCLESTFLIYTNLILLFIFGFIYPGYPHHFIFFYLYVILFLWIHNNKYSDRYNLPCNQVKLDFLSILIMILMFFPQQTNIKYVYYGNTINVMGPIKIFNSDPRFRGCRLLLSEKLSIIAPYLRKDIEVYNLCNFKPLYWDTFYNRKCISLDKINHYFNDDKSTYILHDKIIPNIPYYNLGKNYIFLAIKQRNK